MGLNETERAALEAAMRAALAEMDQDENRGAEGRKTVTLDQQAIGRLSRQDALMNQAMAKATHARRGQSRQRLLAALDRMQDGEYGYCTECGEPIPLGRLRIDPTVPTCVSCLSGGGATR